MSTKNIKFSDLSPVVNPIPPAKTKAGHPTNNTPEQERVQDAANTTLKSLKNRASSPAGFRVEQEQLAYEYGFHLIKNDAHSPKFFLPCLYKNTERIALPISQWEEIADVFRAQLGSLQEDYNKKRRTDRLPEKNDLDPGNIRYMQFERDDKGQLQFTFMTNSATKQFSQDQEWRSHEDKILSVTVTNETVFNLKKNLLTDEKNPVDIAHFKKRGLKQFVTIEGEGDDLTFKQSLLKVYYSAGQTRGLDPGHEHLMPKKSDEISVQFTEPQQFAQIYATHAREEHDAFIESQQKPTESHSSEATPTVYLVIPPNYSNEQTFQRANERWFQTRFQPALPPLGDNTVTLGKIFEQARGAPNPQQILVLHSEETQYNTLNRNHMSPDDIQIFQHPALYRTLSRWDTSPLADGKDIVTVLIPEERKRVNCIGYQSYPQQVQRQVFDPKSRTFKEKPYAENQKMTFVVSNEWLEDRMKARFLEYGIQKGNALTQTDSESDDAFQKRKLLVEKHGLRIDKGDHENENDYIQRVTFLGELQMQCLIDQEKVYRAAKAARQEDSATNADLDSSIEMVERPCGINLEANLVMEFIPDTVLAADDVENTQPGGAYTLLQRSLSIRTQAARRALTEHDSFQMRFTNYSTNKKEQKRLKSRLVKNIDANTALDIIENCINLIQIDHPGFLKGHDLEGLNSAQRLDYLERMDPLARRTLVEDYFVTKCENDTAALTSPENQATKAMFEKSLYHCFEYQDICKKIGRLCMDQRLHNDYISDAAKAELQKKIETMTLNEMQVVGEGVFMQSLDNVNANTLPLELTFIALSLIEQIAYETAKNQKTL